MFIAVCALSGFRGFAEDYYYDVTENSRYQEYEEEVARSKAAGEVQYYDTPEEAIENHDYGEEDNNLRRIDQVLMKIEDEDGLIVAYLNKKSENVLSLNVCKVGKEEIEGKTKYYFYVSAPCDLGKGWIDTVGGDERGLVESKLKYRELFNVNMSINRHKRFLYGIHYYPNIYSLKIEGQPPTEIIPFDFFGATYYFWYYDDLKAEKPCAQMEFTIDPLPDYRSYLWANRQSAWTRIKLFFEWLF